AVRRDGAVKVDGVAVPYLRAASAIYMSGETPSGPKRSYGGALIVTLDFRPLLRRLCQNPYYLTYLTNKDGDFIAHPDPSVEFAFEENPPRHVGLPADFLEEMRQFELSRPLRGNASAVETTDMEAPGFQYQPPWHPPRPVFLLRLRVRDREQWQTANEVHAQLAEHLHKLRERGLLTCSPELYNLQESQAIY